MKINVLTNSNDVQVTMQECEATRMHPHLNRVFSSAMVAKLNKQKVENETKETMNLYN